LYTDLPYASPETITEVAPGATGTVTLTQSLGSYVVRPARPLWVLTRQVLVLARE
jgi:hypothetical protein